MLAATLLAGCSGGDKTPSVTSVGNGSPAPSTDLATQIQRYRDCLIDNGAKLLDEPTAEGLPQIDKEHTNVDVLTTAMQKCSSQLPTAVDAPKVDSGAIETQQRLAQCLRAHGVPDYPDPDPNTGQPELSADLANRLKNDPALVAAMDSCRAQVGVKPTGGTVGG
jgi:hypothetical protein